MLRGILRSGALGQHLDFSGQGPHYSKTAPTARKIFEQRCKRLLQHNLPIGDMAFGLGERLAAQSNVRAYELEVWRLGEDLTRRVAWRIPCIKKSKKSKKASSGRRTIVPAAYLMVELALS
jgi:hypothetical protein